MAYRDLFSENSQRLANTHGWLSPQSVFAIAQSASNPDDAEGMASALAKSDVDNSPEPLGGFFDDGRLYEEAPPKVKVARYLRGAVGPLPVSNQNVRDVQQQLADIGLGEGLSVNGVWSAEWQSALYDMEKQNFDRQLSKGGGKGFSVNNALGWFDAVLAPGIADFAISMVKNLPGDIRNLIISQGSNLAEIPSSLMGDGSNTQAGGKDRYEAEASLENFLFGDTTAEKRAARRGIIVNEDGEEDWVTVDDQWAKWHEIAGQVGTLFMLLSVVGKAGQLGGKLAATSAEGVSKEAAVRGPGAISRKLFGITGEKARPLSYADELAQPSAIAGTFDEAGSAGTQAFQNIPSLVDDLPVIRGKYGYHLGDRWGTTADRVVNGFYKARTFAATPYQSPAVRMAAQTLGTATNLSIRGHLLAATSELGPGTNEFARGIQDQTIVRDWDRKNVKERGLIAGLDNLLFFLHPIAGVKGAGRAATGVGLAEEASKTFAKVTESLDTFGLPQAVERAMKLSHTKSQTYEQLGRALNRTDDTTRLHRYIEYAFNRYVLDKVVNDLVSESDDFARTADEWLHARQVEAKEIDVDTVVTYTDEQRMAVRKEVEAVMKRAKQTELRTNPELMKEAQLRGLASTDNDGFVQHFVDTQTRMYMDRNATGLDSWDEAVTDINSFIDASDIYNNRVAPQLQANVEVFAQNVGTANQGALDMADYLPGLRQAVVDTKAAYNAAKQATRVALGVEKIAAKKAEKAAFRAIEKAEQAVVKASIDAQNVAEKARVEGIQLGLLDVEDVATAATQAVTKAERGVASARTAAVRGRTIVERAVELGMSEADFAAKRQAAIDEAVDAAIAVMDETPVSASVRKTQLKATATAAGTAFDREIAAQSKAAGNLTSKGARASQLGMTEKALAVAENKAISAAKAADEAEGTPWPKNEVTQRSEAVRRALWDTLATSNPGVKKAQAVVDAAVAEAAARWDEVNAAVAEAGATYTPGGRRRNRFGVEAIEPTAPLDPRSEIDQVLVGAAADAQEAYRVAELRRLYNADPTTYRQYGGYGQELDPVLATAEADMIAAKDALSTAVSGSKQTDAQLARMGIFVSPRADRMGQVRNIGIARIATLTKERGAALVGEFKARFKEIQDSPYGGGKSTSGKLTDETMGTPNPEREYDFDWDMADEAGRAQIETNIRIQTTVDFTQMSDSDFALLQAENPGRWANKPTAVGMSAGAWDQLSDAEKLVLQKAVNSQGPVTSTGLTFADIQLLENEVLAFGFKHFGIGIEEQKKFGGIKGIKALIDQLDQKVQKLSGEVTLADDADPMLHQAAADLDALGYKMVVGHELGFQVIPQRVSDVLEFKRVGWMKQSLVRMGLSPDLVINSSISQSQRANRLQRFQELLSEPSYARPGLDSLGLDSFISAWRNGKLDLAGDTDSTIEGFVKGTRKMLRAIFGASVRAGKERKLLEEAFGSLGEEVTSYLQLRDLPRRKLVRALTSQTVMDEFFGTNLGLRDAGVPRVNAFTDVQANKIYREIVKSYSVPVRAAGISNLDNLFRASASWVGDAGWWRTPAGGAVLGAGTGLAMGTSSGEQPDELLESIVQGAVAGGVGAGAVSMVGFGDNLGWAMANMPNVLKVAATKARFDLNPLFSLQQIAETNTKLTLRGVTPTVRPIDSIAKYATNVAKRTPEYRQLTEKADQVQFLADARKTAIQEAQQILHRDDVMPELGTVLAEAADDADRFLMAQDVFGFYNGRSHQMHAAYMLEKQGLSNSQIRETIIDVFAYGKGTEIGRSAIERSANFVFFPLSFNKTVVRNVGMYLLDRPAQIIFMQQSLAAYNAFSEAYPNTPGASEWLENKMPILKEVARLNSFAYGLNMGELGGVNAPILQLFLPQQWRTSKDSTAALKRFIPVLKNFQRIKEAVLGQAYVVDTAIGNRSRNPMSDKNFLANPQQSTDSPATQLRGAFEYQRVLYDAYEANILANAKTRDLSKKYYFPAGPEMGKYAGQEITASRVKDMVEDRFPAYNGIAGVFSVIQSNSDVTDYEDSLRVEGEDQRLAVLDEFVSSVTKFGNILRAEPAEMSSERIALAAQITSEYRSKAIWLAQQDPRFYELYDQVFERVLGPLEDYR